MLIGEVAQLAQVTPRAVRHYHRIGLLPEPGRGSNGYRVYSVVDVTRLLRIRRLVALGLPLERVRLVVVAESDRTTAAELVELEGALREHIRVLNRQLDTVVAAQASSIMEATPLYDQDHQAIQAMWSDPEVRQIESDVGLLLAATRDDRLLDRLRTELADPLRIESLALMASHLHGITNDSSEDERVVAIASLRAGASGIEDVRIEDPALRALLEDHISRSFNFSQLDVMRRAFPS